jgi:hypothetical protein
MQVAGIGSLEPNTVLLGWNDDQLKRAQFVRAIGRILELQRNLLIFAEAELPEEELEPVIDVWWRARVNGGFMLTLAHLLQEGGGGTWRDHPDRVRRIISSEAGVADADANLRAAVDEMRIEAEVEIIVADKAPL